MDSVSATDCGLQSPVPEGTTTGPLSISSEEQILDELDDDEFDEDPSVEHWEQMKMEQQLTKLDEQDVQVQENWEQKEYLRQEHEEYLRQEKEEECLRHEQEEECLRQEQEEWLKQEDCQRQEELDRMFLSKSWHQYHHWSPPFILSLAPPGYNWIFEEVRVMSPGEFGYDVLGYD
jgi:hypothetical protein